ncbi:hypothetical protein BT96DRAFT_1019530 [Gymnopus androsaceus JB14]|uniref:Uncharacterized protein n=1 Tax=Gymnopus androsaceus JB14 TaxID=1447944 RepID=A0A6A4HNZ1_9AGAR|nr:hypothetical protein BT96DRAFT_1019530 [Gymnopus androsaceus JB14]
MATARTGTRNFQIRSNIDFTELRSRLRSEHGHSDAEIAGALTDIDKDLEDCDAEVVRLQSRIISMQNQRRHLEEGKRRLEECKACLRFLRSPIRKLPKEALLRIFDFACGINEITSKKLSTMPTLSISGVCLRWRNLAQSYPILWSRIRIEMQTTPPNYPILRLLNLYNERSRNSPLTFEITGPTDGCDPQPHHRALCTSIAAHSNRWQKLTVHEPKVFDALVALNPRRLLMLEVLNIDSLFCDESSDFDMFENSPIRSLSVYAVSREMRESKFPWKQLTQLDVAQHAEGMKTLLEASGKLTELRLREVDGKDYFQQCAIVPLLETLSLNLSQTSLSESLAEVAFSSMTCPSLTSLLIEASNNYKGYKRIWPKESLHGFISRSSFHLSTLSIKSIPLSDSNLIDLLRRLPSLLHLTIDDSKATRAASSTTPSPITPHLIQSLHAFPDMSSVAVSSALAQKLQSLELTFSGSDFDEEGFVDMVSSRWLADHEPDGYGPLSPETSLNSDVGTACLRSIVLRLRNQKMDVKTYRPMKFLEKAGMRVVVVDKKSTMI